MDKDDIQILAAKLDGLIKLTVMMGEEKSQAEQIWLLSIAGLQPKEIAETLNTTPNNVRVTLSNMRKQKKSKTSKK